MSHSIVARSWIRILVCFFSCGSVYARDSVTLSIDMQTLRESALLQVAQFQAPQQVMRYQLTEQMSVALEPQRVDQEQYFGANTISGRLDDGGWFLISESDESAHGAFWTADGSWELHSDGEVDLAGNLQFTASRVEHVADCSGGHVPEEINVPLADQLELTSDPPSSEDLQDSVRVLIVYDENARRDVGNMESFAVSCINSANNAYRNSNIEPMRLTLVGIEQVETTSGNGGLHLRKLTDRYDGYMDDVHALRDAYDADLVALLVDLSGFCGVAWLSPTNALYGFSVTDTDCAVGNLTFAHELGHNFGAAHDLDNAGSAYTSYAYGHRWNSNTWRSVMAYSPGSRVPYFSNPNVLFAGFATGIANARDNARLHNATDVIVANMRQGDGSGVDCNQDGTTDEVEIARDPLLDRDQDGFLDSCLINIGFAKDCDDNGVIDSEQLLERYSVELGPVGPFGSNTPVILSTPALPTPADSELVIITVAATGDLGSSNEFLSLNFNDGALFYNSVSFSGSGCYSPGQRQVYNVASSVFAPIAAAGIDLEILSSSAVSATECTHTSLVVTIEYKVDRSDLDLDQDGLLTICEMMCFSDISGDGDLDFEDVETLYDQFGSNGVGYAADMNHNLSVDVQDLAILQAGYKLGCR